MRNSASAPGMLSLSRSMRSTRYSIPAARTWFFWQSARHPGRLIAAYSSTRHCGWYVPCPNVILSHMQHIGIDTRLTYYRKGGISTYMRRIVSALESIDYDNRYTIFHSRKAQESLARRFQSAALWTPCHHRLERYTISAELARFKLDLLHSPDFIPPLRGARRHIVTI